MIKHYLKNEIRSQSGFADKSSSNCNKKWKLFEREVSYLLIELSFFLLSVFQRRMKIALA